MSNQANEYRDVLKLQGGGAEAGPGARFCLSYFSIAVIRRHDKGNFQKTLLGLTVSEGESVVILVGSTGSRQADMAPEQYLRTFILSTSKRQRELTETDTDF